MRRDLGAAFALAAALLGGFAAFFVYQGATTVDGAGDAVVLAVAAGAGALVAIGISRLLQRRGPIPGRVPLLFLLTAPLWGRVPEAGRIAIFGGFAGYFAALVGLVAGRIRRARV